jgi:hypothetical protein
LWERTRVKKLADCDGGFQRFVYRYRLTSDETLLVVALLYGQSEEATGGTFRLHLEALYEGKIMPLRFYASYGFSIKKVP